MDKFEPQSAGGMHMKEGHEERDLSIRAIVLFGLCLVVCGFLSFVGIWALMHGLEWWERKNEAKLTPVQQELQKGRAALPPGSAAMPLPATEQGVKPPADYATRAAEEQHIVRTFPTPRLQYDDVYDLNLFRNSENAWLNSTGKDPNGDIHIPISRAMELLVQRGLPATTGVFTTESPTGVPTNPSRASSHEHKQNRGMRGDVSH